MQAENKNEAPQYDGTWRDADPAEVKAKIDAGETYTYRFKVPKGKVRAGASYSRGRSDRHHNIGPYDSRLNNTLASLWFHVLQVH